MADTFPFESTVATLALEEDHTTFLFVAFDGVTVATNCSVPPISKVIDDLFRLTPVTVIAFTVTEHVAFFPPSSVVTVIFADPTPMPVTLPF
jgi:hypothetical protein